MVYEQQYFELKTARAPNKLLVDGFLYLRSLR